MDWGERRSERRWEKTNLGNNEEDIMMSYGWDLRPQYTHTHTHHVQFYAKYVKSQMTCISLENAIKIDLRSSIIPEKN